MSCKSFFSCRAGQVYTMAGVGDGVISTQGPLTLAVFETLLAEEAKFQIMTSPSSDKPISIPINIYIREILTRARNNHVITQL